MCGRFTREFTWREVHDFLSLRFPTPGLPVAWLGAPHGPSDAPAPGLPISFNVAPTHQSVVLRLADVTPELALARWGLVPSWAADPAIGSSMINARAETVASKPAFRQALARRRCVVPMSAFYEWAKSACAAEPGGPTEAEPGLFGVLPPTPTRRRSAPVAKVVKQPWYIHRADGSPLLAAGLWETWRPRTGEGGAPGGVLETFTIITVAANAFMARLHDRMPAVLEPESLGRWLDARTPPEAAVAMLVPASDGVLTAHRVGGRVSSPGHNDADLIRPV